MGWQYLILADRWCLGVELELDGVNMRAAGVKIKRDRAGKHGAQHVPVHLKVGFQDLERPLRIVADPTHFRGQVEHDVLTGADPMGNLPIEKVGFVERNLPPDRLEGFLFSALEIINHGDAGTGGDERGCQMRPDEAGAARYENGFSGPKRHRRLQALPAGVAARSGLVISCSKTSPIRLMSNS